MLIVNVRGAESETLRAALDYARRGWRVFPLWWIEGGRCACEIHDTYAKRRWQKEHPGKPFCCPNKPGKHPLSKLVKHGVKDATTDQEALASWWGAYPLANVAIATGKDSGVFAVGPDRQGGLDDLAELQAIHGKVPETVTVNSGTAPGQHLYFRWPADGHSVANRVNHSGTRIDIRGEGGYVVAPPSANDAGSYAWAHGPDGAIAEAPKWLLDWIRTEDQEFGKRGRSEPPDVFASSDGQQASASSWIGTASGSSIEERAVKYLANCDPSISAQGGHIALLNAARGLAFGFNLDQGTAFRLLRDYFNPRCQPLWTDKELLHKCEEADTKPYAKPRGYLLAEAQDGQQHQRATTSTPELGIEAMPMPEPAPWPTLPEAALHGLAGEIIRSIEPHTEADSVAILGQLLTMFGNAAGRGPHFMVEGDEHRANLFTLLVGESSRGRKGTSRGRVLQLFRLADPHWCESAKISGLGSGEGLISALVSTDAEEEPVANVFSRVVRQCDDLRRRLLIDAPEFASPLKVMRREGNTLSDILRQAWDGSALAITTRNNPLRAPAGHVSLIGHTSKAELAVTLKEVDFFNGMVNRLLLLLVRRSKHLPDGGGDLDVTPLAKRLGKALGKAQQIGRMTRSDSARRLWHEEYPRLTAERPGLFGAATGRAEAQALRLSIAFALLDGQGVIDEPHLQAALAMWSYAEQSAKIIFACEKEDPLEERVLEKLQAAGPVGMSRTELRDAFNRNLDNNALLGALAKLRDRGTALAFQSKTGGRPAERWRSVRPNDRTTERPKGAEIDPTSVVRSFGRSVVDQCDSADGYEEVIV